MEFVMTFVNVIVIPYLACIISAKRQSKDIVFDAKLLNEYVPYMVANIICAHAILIVAEKVAGIGGVEMYSWVYSVAAVISACVLPIIAEILSKYFEVKLEISKKER